METRKIFRVVNFFLPIFGKIHHEQEHRLVLLDTMIDLLPIEKFKTHVQGF